MSFNFNQELIEKIGNAMIFICDNTNPRKMSKTKMLKMIYIIDETSVKKTGFPVFNLDYRVWKFGPVDTELFLELNSGPYVLKEYITRVTNDNRTYIRPKKKFEDDEFSDNEINTMTLICNEYDDCTGQELIAITHKEKSPWYNKAKEHNVLEKLNNETLSTTDIKIDLSEVIQHDQFKTELLKEFLEVHGVHRG
jgi:uncharacterized phage-associated protein